MSIAGTWQNEYGSIMNLETQGNLVNGSYQSSTGSVGIYEVVGVQLNSAPSPALGQPVALAIEWHSVGDDPADPSWNWCSGLSGQISVQNGEEVLALSHLMIASSDFPGLAAAGNYNDKLIYRRVTGAARRNLSRREAAQPSDPLAGTWISDDGIAMTLQVTPESQHRFGSISGTLMLPGGAATVTGFTDINATADGLALQSVAITLLDQPNTLAISLSGTLDLASGVLELLEMRSGPTSAANSYTQTRMSAARYTRQ